MPPLELSGSDQLVSLGTPDPQSFGRLFDGEEQRPNSRRWLLAEVFEWLGVQDRQVRSRLLLTLTG